MITVPYRNLPFIIKLTRHCVKRYIYLILNNKCLQWKQTYPFEYFIYICKSCDEGQVTNSNGKTQFYPTLNNLENWFELTVLRRILSDVLGFAIIYLNILFFYHYR